MAIPESQLETWCKQGATVTSAAAYTSIKTALTTASSKVSQMSLDIYLQGSYGNNTNIYADSDVDVVVEYDSAWYPDLSALPQYQQQAYHEAYGNSAYNWKNFYSDVLDSLRDYYGNATVTPGNKAIRVTTPNGRTADVVPAFDFKKFAFFQAPAIQSYTEGIRFEDQSGRIIINYPKLHIKNGEVKNSPTRTTYRYKQTVRMFKNARNTAIDKRLVSSDVAPSYFVECLLYNVPDDRFGGSYQQTYFNVMKFLLELQLHTCMCQNGQIPLFGTSSVQWSEANANSTLRSLVELWDNW